MYVLCNIEARSATIIAVVQPLVFYSYCMSLASYPACKAHVPYCHLWPVWLLHNTS